MCTAFKSNFGATLCQSTFVLRFTSNSLSGLISPQPKTTICSSYPEGRRLFLRIGDQFSWQNAIVKNLVGCWQLSAEPFCGIWCAFFRFHQRDKKERNHLNEWTDAKQSLGADSSLSLFSPPKFCAHFLIIFSGTNPKLFPWHSLSCSDC